MIRTIHITTGDPEGIGLEVSLKALEKLGPKKNVQFILWRKKSVPPLFKPLLMRVKKKYSQNFIEKAQDSPPFHWVRAAARDCLQNPSKKALVTAPLSKKGIKEDGLLFKGHTPYLQHLTKTKNIRMVFLGKKFNVVLNEGHREFKKIRVKSSSLEETIQKTLLLRKILSPKKQKKPLGLLGLNPHAGEGGLLGREEEDILKPLVKKLEPEVKGPLAPDSAFHPQLWPAYSFYLCLYHDQALIPFKMAHGWGGVQLSMGLSFLRLSPAHGTGKDIYGQNRADCSSLFEALKRACLFKGFRE